VIKIEAKDLPKVTVGDPEKLKVGEWVVAIGKPFGLENTMTAGIVSAKGRDLPQENLVPFIQTDVAINPGNSGGPLFNLKGEVVGINSLIYSRSGGYMGLAFAIPIDVAMNTVSQLRDKGRVTRGRIGVQIQEVTKESADSFGLKAASGALVNSVEKGGRRKGRHRAGRHHPQGRRARGEQQQTRCRGSSRRSGRAPRSRSRSGAPARSATSR